MNLLDMIKTRRSIRKYKSDMVPKEIIDKIVEAGTYAATGMGQQSPIILAVTNKEVRINCLNGMQISWEQTPIHFMEHLLYWLS